ncbi:MAG TPA: hypothetical protein VHV08_17525 [Pirellulales bacterium]|jgi:hypothetical protein|nr:hypothetical protein [Pirellulales bacterium]
MKKFAMLALLLSACTLTVGCNKPTEKKPAMTPEATPAAAPADTAPADGTPAETPAAAPEQK